MVKIEKIPFTPKGDWRSKKWGYLREAKKMNNHIKDGDVVYDCGANVFDHTIFFALNNPKSIVVAFEPIKEYFEMGLKNAEFFKVENIIPMNVAVGEKREKMEISVSNEGSSLVYEHKGSDVEKIEVETIDYLVENKVIPAPDVIKIDVEGFALPLIRGASATIKKYKPTIIIEIHPNFVGENEARQKIYELQKYGLNVIEQLGEWREFVLSNKGESLDFDFLYNIHSIQKMRDRYDSSKNKEERSKIEKEYIEIKNKTPRVPITRRLIWSKFYVFFKNLFRWV